MTGGEYSPTGYSSQLCSAQPFQLSHQHLADEIGTLEQNLARWRSAMHSFSESQRFSRPKDLRAKLECQLLQLMEAASRLWLSGMVAAKRSTHIFEEALILAREILEGFKEADFEPVSKPGLWSRISIFDEQFSRQPSLLPNISKLHDQYGDEYVWECNVVIGLIMLYLEVESGVGDDSYSGGAALQGITIDNIGRSGTIQYTRNLNGAGEQHKELLVWW